MWFFIKVSRCYLIILERELNEMAMYQLNGPGVDYYFRESDVIAYATELAEEIDSDFPDEPKLVVTDLDSAFDVLAIVDIRVTVVD